MRGATRVRQHADDLVPDPADPTPRLGIAPLRLAAGCALLIGLALVQDPGFLVPDTKFDLVAAPGDFLARAMHLWDAEGAFGQVQNQGYGYLWPMGPFFWLGDLLGAPGWAVQRSWQALVLCVAFVGCARLARALGVRTDAACLIAAVAYALSPRMLTTLGPISIEAWPSALAPWVLLPLVVGASRGSPRRAAALSAFAIAMVGGVNAAATFAVVPLGALWILTRARGRRQRSMMLWWPVFTALGTLWWLVPLGLLGAYSPPFLDYIETSAVTTFPTTLVDTLRGTSDWVPYVDSASRAGNDLVTTGYLAVNSGVVLLVGFIGLLDRTNPHRRFLGLGLGLGVVMVGAGHVGSVEGWAANDVQALLDGVLSPLRNVHKFDPLVRLPLVLGVAWALDRVLALDRGPVRPRLERVAFTAMTLAAVAGAALPAFTARIEPAGATLEVPAYWTEAADWLAEESDGGVALLVPGSAFGSYLWGDTRDEPLQWLADSRWAVRNVIPLAPSGNIRMLDEIERRLADGSGSPGLTAYLRRAGVEYLVVRNDLATGPDVPDPVVVHEALAESPDVERVAEFGPLLGGAAHVGSDVGSNRRILVNSGRQAIYPAVEVFEVGGAPAVIGSEVTVVAGGPEDLLDLADLGVLADEPTVLGLDVPHLDLGALPTGQVVLTDGLRDRERQFARIHDGYGPTRDPGAVRRTTNPTPDYELGVPGVGDSVWRTTVRLDGARALSASSSASDAVAPGGTRPGEMPAAAIDGDPSTSWISRAGEREIAWWSLDLGRELPATVVLTGGLSATDNQAVRVVTAAGTSERVLLGPGETREVSLPLGPSTWVRVENASSAGGQMTLAEVSLPGATVRRSLVLPRLPDGWGAPDVVVLRTAGGRRTGCVTIGTDVRCSADRAVPDEEPSSLRRVVPSAEVAAYEARMTVVPRASRALDRLALRGQAVAVAVSSRPVPDPRAGAVAAIDGDPGTTWTAAVGADRPQITVRWLDRRTISGLTLSTDPDAPAAAPTVVLLRWRGGKAEVPLVNGRVTFPPVVTNWLRVRVLDVEPVADLDFNAQPRQVPAGISELTIKGVPYLPLRLSADPVELTCGSGPDVRVGDRRYESAVTASPLELARGLPVPARLCTSLPIQLEAGDNEVEAIGTRAFAVSSLVFARDDAASDSADVATLEVDGPSHRRVLVGDDARVVALRENTNAGWTARIGDVALEPVVVDGWQQGFLVPDGLVADSDSAAVEIEFAPDAIYRLGLLAGGIALALLGAVLLVTRRRWAGPLPDAVGTGHLPTPLLLTGAAVLAGMVAGWVGVLVAGGAGLVAWALDRWAAEAAPLLLALPCLVATLPYFVNPWGSLTWAGDSAWPHYVVLVPLVSVLVLAAAPRDPARAGLRSRLRGRRSAR